jgi:putative Holliday junction resolvase
MASKTIIGLDVGSARIGVAIATHASHLPSPYGVILHDRSYLDNLLKLFIDQKTDTVVVGLPRSLNGQDTPQTKLVRQFAYRLKQTSHLPVHFQDEALTSQLAEQELRQRKIRYTKAMVDALAATYILSDFLREHQEEV